jgi:transposase InsO family protein
MPTDTALLRYQVVSAYLGLEPARGHRGPLLAQLAARTWPAPDGEPVRVRPETIRGWVRRFRTNGLAGLEDAPRPKRGEVALPPELVEKLAALKRQVPERTLDHLIRIAEDIGLVEKGVVRRSTLHRALARRGLSRRPTPERTVKDLDRFEAPFPNHTWQGDAKAGPWLPDPDQPKKRRQAWLFAFLDDHSRHIVGSRWDFKQDQPTMELVLRRALQRHGVPARIYTDNGSVYRAHHMVQVADRAGRIVLVFCTADRPEGKGKIERFWRTSVLPFVAEVAASSIRTIEELNAAWRAWLDRTYHQEIHGETGMRPPDRWKTGIDKVRWIDEDKLRAAFRWTETRKADRAGCFTLFGVRFQVGAALAGRRVRIAFDPEDLTEVEVVDDDGKRLERLRPFEVREHRRPPAKAPAPASDEAATVDYLALLVGTQKPTSEPDARQLADDDRRRRQRADDAVVEVLRTALNPVAFDEPRVRAWLDRFGPLDADPLADALPALLARLGPGVHVQVLLDTFRKENP